ncbi:MAG: hypothetical protein HOI23_03875 [Deltaproteobacteria bacterium]|jgi:hypothetical protein|nr:hypothetical protein [Deltaproteobacteria bacterium]MBT6492319.1 hypothetical protein [Deltaproteobacteria bacterium]
MVEIDTLDTPLFAFFGAIHFGCGESVSIRQSVQPQTKTLSEPREPKVGSFGHRLSSGELRERCVERRRGIFTHYNLIHSKI